MIIEDRLRHILSVARRCYEIASESGHEESFCKRMFAVGFLHDIGYEFSDNRDHASEGAALMKAIGVSEEYVDAVRRHGAALPAEEQPEILRILNRSDIETSSSGEKTTAHQRLKDVEVRYGRNSVQYRDMEYLCRELGLIQADCSHK